MLKDEDAGCEEDLNYIIVFEKWACKSTFFYDTARIRYSVISHTRAKHSAVWHGAIRFDRQEERFPSRAARFGMENAQFPVTV